MSDYKLDISKLEQDYPFLDTVWNTYNEFDNPVDDDHYKSRYEAFCGPLMKELGDSNVENKKFCLKLVRNLGRYSEDFKFQRFNSEDCTNLNNWVYDSKMKYDIPDDIIDRCYQDYNYFASVTRAKLICPYNSYDDMYQPINIIMLKIFESNVHLLVNILNEETNSHTSSCQKYVCELVNIYNYMKSIFCSKVKEGGLKKEKTCDILDKFYISYKLFFLNRLNNTKKIPSLDNLENEYSKKCYPDKPVMQLSASRNEERPAIPPLIEDKDSKSDEFYSQPLLNDENTGNSMTRTVSTAVGTMAGASSILALLYKFTPGRNWMRSGSRGRISNNLYSEQANELFYDGFEGEVMSSHNPTYNVGYGSV